MMGEETRLLYRNILHPPLRDSKSKNGKSPFKIHMVVFEMELGMGKVQTGIHSLRQTTLQESRDSDVIGSNASGSSGLGKAKTSRQSERLRELKTGGSLRGNEDGSVASPRSSRHQKNQEHCCPCQALRCAVH
ncbi:hypothetical protein EYF80_021110 [Liparis tanakae]|uniref:Uncharacterized protein n=1 Tax=Liparis tanakae TaxID=230148 RepID=A0A4Z2HT26_9TELE|nr:hypothetical protein EYF80_021110 [Liparis tanakae]